MSAFRYPAQRIAVLHLNQIGDLLFSLPLLHTLRKHAPDVRLASIVRAHLVDLMTAADVVHDTMVIPGKRVGVAAVARALRGGRFDSVIALSGTYTQVLGAYLARVRWRLGFADAVLPMLLTGRAAGRGVPSIDKMATMAHHLGCDTDIGTYAGLISATEDQRRAGQRLLRSAGASESDRFAALGPGASARRSFKAWRADRFAVVADHLAARHGLIPVILGGARDRDQADEISQLSRAPIIDLTGDTTTGEALGVLAACSLFVGIDSGLMHMAAALDLPVVALFGPTDPALTGPRCSTSAIVRKPLACSPCHDPACRRRECMDSIAPEEVLDAVARMMRAVGLDGADSLTAATGALPGPGPRGG